MKTATEAPFIKLTLTAEPTQHPDAEINYSFLRISDTTVTVSDEQGRQIGEVSAAIGGAWLISDTQSGLAFKISARQVWKVFQKALKIHPDYQRLIRNRGRDTGVQK